ncbi:hypothetical protein [Asticcacaulis sp. MM231]|uniref:hypothetical protein n=1 Tax=Asticcacaulis sp. MM231 TaxID=3157666 RepID=UPI0032D56D8B
MLVDALTGTAIIALMIALCLTTIKIARSQTQTARDMGDAQHLMIGLMEATPRIAGDYKGVSGGLAYKVTVQSKRVNDVPMCEISVDVRAPKRQRAYHLVGTRWCSQVPVS